jgi:aryl-alcohol dehydrogenase-like predicted oxidoreductase
LGLAAHPDQDPRCIKHAFRSGINYFFFYGPGHKEFVQGLRPLVRSRRTEIILASGSGARRAVSLRAAKRRILAAIASEILDIFFAEYINPGDDEDTIFGDDGVLDELQRWKSAGSIRYVGATAHDRPLAKRLAEDHRVDVLMHRINLAHRRAANEVFPAAVQTRTPIIAFTATRWGTLLKPPADGLGEPPTAADCYRYCLSHPAVRMVLTAPKTLQELRDNIKVLDARPMSRAERAHWERHGDIVYKSTGAQAHEFESLWP